MPTYEYACKECGQHHEVQQSFSDAPLTTCPACGGPLRKVFGSIGIAFKGSGFYKTDSRAASTTASKNGDKAKGESSSESSSSPSSSEKSASSSDNASSSSPSPSSDKGSSASAPASKSA
jgi:putative FmdB family regulatory protein